MRTFKIGFVTGIGGFPRLHLLAAKYLYQRLTGAHTPDVYALPRFLGVWPDFIRIGQSVSAPEFDLIFAELNGNDRQLEYLDALVAAQRLAVAVVPGPPELLGPRLTHRKLLQVRRILSGARYVLAYSDMIASFYDGLIGHPRSQVIPWPFDYKVSRRLAGSMASPAHTIRVVLNVPLRFDGRAPNYPFVLKAALLDALATLPPAERRRLSFHTFVYSRYDREQFDRSGFAEGIPVTLEPQRLFQLFVRFLGSCDGVVNLTSSNILGRITFLSAALDKPGLFTSNAEINKTLYPGGTVPLLAPLALREGLTALLSGLVGGNVPARFMPDSAATRKAGDFAANARVFGGLFTDLVQASAPAAAGTLR